MTSLLRHTCHVPPPVLFLSHSIYIFLGLSVSWFSLYLIRTNIYTVGSLCNPERLRSTLGWDDFTISVSLHEPWKFYILELMRELVKGKTAKCQVIEYSLLRIPSQGTSCKARVVWERPWPMRSTPPLFGLPTQELGNSTLEQNLNSGTQIMDPNCEYWECLIQTTTQAQIE